MKAYDNFYMVGIGYSAGGIDPLKTFLSHLPTLPGACFVVVNHQSMEAERLLDNILACCTTMHVDWVKHRQQPRVNSIYLLPPGQMMTLDDQGFCLRERRAEEKINQAIDIFFTSMAEHMKNRAIGVILSGSNEDGLAGIKAIGAHGGIVMVQEPDSATFARMPDSIINGDSPDLILSPEHMAQALRNFIRVEPFKQPIL